MPSPSPGPDVPAETERSALGGFLEPVCAVCGGSRDPRKRATCSNRCRTAFSRRHRLAELQKRDDEIRVALETIKDQVQAALARLG